MSYFSSRLPELGVLIADQCINTQPQGKYFDALTTSSVLVVLNFFLQMLAQDNYDNVLWFVNHINEEYERTIITRSIKPFSDTIKKKWVKERLRCDLWEYL